MAKYQQEYQHNHSIYDRVKMICSNISPAKPSTLRKDRIHSSLGMLGRFPPAILYLTLEHLDFRSLSRLSRVSWESKALVENLPSYQQTMRHVPQLLTALSKTNVIELYSSSFVLHTLRSWQCFSCYNFGGFLHLSIGRRICLECLHLHHGVWMIRTAKAQAYFGLTEDQLASVPILRTIPGSYAIRTEPCNVQRIQVVSVMHAKLLGLVIHKTSANMAKFKHSKKLGRGDVARFRLYHEAPIGSVGHDMLQISPKPKGGADDLAGVASLRIPYLSPSGADWGLLCRGCEYNFTHLDDRTPFSPVRLGLCEPGLNAFKVFRAAAFRLHSFDGIMEHASVCRGLLSMAQEEDMLNENWMRG